MIAKPLNEVHSGVLLVVGLVVGHSLYFDLDVGERHRQHIDEIARDIEDKKE